MKIISFFSRLLGGGKVFMAKMKKTSCLMALWWFLGLTGVGQNAIAATQIMGTDFETGTIQDAFKLSPPAVMSVEISSAKAHSGTKSMFYHPSYGDSTNPPMVDLPNLSTVYAKWWWWVPSTLEGGVGGHHAFRFSKREGDSYLRLGELDTGMGAGGTGFDFAVLTDPSTGGGFDLTDLFNVPQNQWFKFEVLTTLNTVGQKNGVLKVWINGNLAYSNTALTYTTDPNWRYNTFMAVSNIDGSSSASYWYMDDFEVWDGLPSNIAPSTSPSPSPSPSPPTGLVVK